MSDVVEVSVSLQSINQNAVVTEVTASLEPLSDNPGVSVVVLEIEGWALTPLGLSYQVVVIADPPALAPA